MSGIREGFRIGFDYSHSCRSSSRNMLSAMEKPQIVSEYLAEECAEGRILGPFAHSKLPQVHTRCFGIIPKGTTGKWWLIVDMSSPEGASANDAIRESLSSLSYIGIRDAAKGIVAKGRGALLVKVDVKSAYRNISVHLDDRWLLGMQWEGALFVDTALLFGLRSTPKIFMAIANAVEWIVKAEEVNLTWTTSF